jgi:diguanylate cyclase (GGDEF)-like protein
MWYNKGMASLNHEQETHPFFDLANQRLQNTIDTLKIAIAYQEEAQHAYELTRRDALTGLYTRPVMAETYSGLRQEGYQHGRASDTGSDNGEHSVVLLDVDDFKSVNDEKGHAEGDRVLREVGATILNTVRKRDVPIRIGGEEIAIILPRTSEQGAKKLAEKVRRKIAREVGVTASLGVAKLNLDSWTLEEDMSNADTAMYAAKKRGKNRTVLFSELEDNTS